MGMDFVGRPGLTTTNSIWSNNQLGASPGNKPTPSSFSASASAFHFSSGFESLSATVAPRFAKNFAQAIPLRAAPITKTFLPLTSKQFHFPVEQTLLSVPFHWPWTGRNACPTAASASTDSTVQTGSPESKSERRSSTPSNPAFQSGDEAASS